MMKCFFLKTSSLRVSYIALAWSFLLTTSWGAHDPDAQLREMLAAQRKTVIKERHHHHTDVRTLEKLSNAEIQAFFDDGHGAEVKRSAVLKELEALEREQEAILEEETRLSTQLRKISADKGASEHALLGMAKSIVRLKESLEAANQIKEKLEEEAKKLRIQCLSKDSFLRVLGERTNLVTGEKEKQMLEARKEALSLKEEKERAETAADEASKKYRKLFLQLKREEAAEKEAKERYAELTKRASLLEDDLTKARAGLSRANDSLVNLRGEKETLMEGIKGLMQSVQAFFGEEASSEMMEGDFDAFMMGTRLDDFLEKAQENLQRMLSDNKRYIQKIEAEKADMAVLSKEQREEIERQRSSLISLEEEKNKEIGILIVRIHDLEDNIQDLRQGEAEKEHQLAEMKLKLCMATLEKDTAERVLIAIQMEKFQLEKENTALIEKLSVLQKKQEQDQRSLDSIARLLKEAEASLEAVKATALREQADSSGRIRTLTEELKKQKEKEQRSTAENREEAASRIKALEVSLAQVRKENAEKILKEKAEAKRRVEAFEEVLRVEMQKVLKSQEALASEHQEALAVQRLAHQAKIRLLEKDIAEKTLFLEEKERVISSSLTQLEKVRSEYQGLEKSLGALEKELLKKIDLLKSAEVSRDTLSSRFSALEKEREKLKGSLTLSESQILDLESQLRSIHASKAVTEQTGTRAEADRARLRLQLAEEQESSQRLQKSLEEARRENKLLKAAMQVLEETLRQAERKLEASSLEVKSKKGEVAASKKALKGERQKLCGLKEKMRSLEESKLNASKLAADLLEKEVMAQAALRKAYEEIREEKEGLQRRLAEVSEESHHHKKVIKEAQETLFEMLPSGEVASYEVSIDLACIRRLISRLKTENQELTEKLLSGQDNIRLLKVEKRDLEQTLKGQEQELFGQRADIEKKTTLFETMSREIGQLHQEIAEQSKVIDTYKSQETVLLGEIEAKEKHVSSLSDTIVSLLSKKESLEKDIRRSEALLEEKMLVNKTLERDLRKTRTSLRESTDKLVLLGREAEDIEATLSEQSTLLVARARTIERLEQEVVALSQSEKEAKSLAPEDLELRAYEQDVHEKERTSLQLKLRDVRDKLAEEEARVEEFTRHFQLLYPKYTEAQEALVFEQRALKTKEERIQSLLSTLQAVEEQRESAVSCEKEEKNKALFLEASLIEAEARNRDLVQQNQALEDMITKLARKAGYDTAGNGYASPREMAASFNTPTRHANISRLGAKTPKSPTLRLLLGTPERPRTTPNRKDFEALMKGMTIERRGDVYGQFLQFLKLNGESVEPGTPLRKALTPSKERPPLRVLNEDLSKDIFG